jgi:acyl dehydratase
VVTSQLLENLIEQGGYVHPLFRTPSVEESTHGLGPPLPGPALLLLMGGLVEKSGLLDQAVAMVGLEEVRFRQMVRAGARISVEVELLDARVTASGRCLERYRWRALTEPDQEAAEATAVMLMRGRSSECVEPS